MSIQREKLIRFLTAVDRDFPRPLSDRMPVPDYADKLLRYADLCTEISPDGEIVGLAAGYSENLVNNTAFIACVAVKRDCRGRGVAPALIKEFFSICEKKDIPAVHVYTEAENLSARKMYEGLGFKRLADDDGSRPEDVHYIKYF